MCEFGNESKIISELALTKFEDYMTSMINDILDNDNVDSSSFSYMFGEYEDREEPLSYIRDYINNNPTLFKRVV
jgi:hypothetical protein